MNKKEQELFVAFFEQIFEAEEEFEDIKKKLIACQHFNPYLLFQHVIANGRTDSEGEGDQLTIAKLREYLADRTSCNQRELYELFERFDHQRLGFICVDDFIKEITPLGKENPPNKAGKVSPEIQGHFLALVNEYLKRFRILEVLRKEVHFIWPYNAFSEIDNFKTGHIGYGELETFFERNDYNVSPEQIEILLHGLKRRCYRDVNLEVFCQNIEPLEFGEYEAYKTNIEEEKEQQFLKRSRREQETMRRSRIESWKIEHGIAKEERRRKAEKERELELEERINKEILDHEKQKQRYVRRAMLEEDKNIRWNVEAGTHALELEKQRQLEERLRNQDLSLIRNQENEVKNVLVRSALKREDELDNSRRVRYNLEREREIQELEYQKELERREIERQRVIAEDLEREREFQRREQITRERILAEELERQSKSQRQKFISEAEASRRIYEEELRLERQRAQREYELERIRSQDYNNRSYESASNSRRVADLERQLEQTRYEIRERQSRLNSSKRQPETADRDYRGYRS